jgi:hypothetical protein
VPTIPWRAGIGTSNENGKPCNEHKILVKKIRTELEDIGNRARDYACKNLTWTQAA